jgi:exonuclease VII large subunit
MPVGDYCSGFCNRQRVADLRAPRMVPAAKVMSPDTIRLHETLIRLLKGVITAWEEWLKAQKQK